MIHYYAKVVPLGKGRYSYEYPLGRGFFRGARRIRRGTIRFWRKEGFEASSMMVIVNLLEPWFSQVKALGSGEGKWRLLVGIDGKSFDVSTVSEVDGALIPSDGVGFELVVLKGWRML